MYRSLLQAGALTAVVGLWLAAPRTASAQYTVAPLSTVFSQASGITNTANLAQFVVAGSAEIAGGNYHAVRWTNSGITDLLTLGGLTSEGYAINDAGNIVGRSQTAAGDYHAFLWSGTPMLDLDGRANRYSEAWAINPSNIVVGVQETDTSPLPPFTTRTFRAFVSVPNATPGGPRTKTELGTLGGQDSEAYGINTAGQITGAAQTGDVPQREHAVIWRLNAQDQYVITDLGTLIAGGWSYSFAINDASRMIGVAQFNAINSSFHAVRWDPDATVASGFRITDLGTLGNVGRNSEALAVNTAGLIVGWSSVDFLDTVRHAFIYQGNAMTDLNTLIPPNSGWELLRADGINDQGQIVGQGLFQGQFRLFILTPGLPST